MKPILPGVHAVVDYLLAIFLALAPAVWGSTGYGAHLAYVLAGIFLLMSLLTDYNGGLIKILSFQIHGLFELLIGVVVIVIGYRDLSGSEQHFFILFGIGLLMFWVLSDYTYIDPEDRYRHFNTH